MIWNYSRIRYFGYIQVVSWGRVKIVTAFIYNPLMTIAKMPNLKIYMYV